MSAKDARLNFSQLVVRFLETKLICPQFQFQFATTKVKNLTRWFRAQVERNGVSIEANVQIQRNINLEKTMLRTASKVIDRRHIVGNSVRQIPPVPQLLSLKSILKTSNKDVGNKRKSMFPRVTFDFSALNGGSSPSTSTSIPSTSTSSPSTSTPKSRLSKGTTAQIIINRLTQPVFSPTMSPIGLSNNASNGGSSPKLDWSSQWVNKFSIFFDDKINSFFLTLEMAFVITA